ncbi:hypothetical protein GCK32_003846, partial [Trichostrongylus colubriformis]
MQVLLLLAFLIVTCHGAGARIHREVQEQQKFVRAATYPPRRSFSNPMLMERSLKGKSRVFRNVQVQADDEPRLYRASGRFQKRVIAAVPLHDVSASPPPVASRLDSATMNTLGYNEDSHHMNKMTEDNSIMEEAAEYAKGLERTTVAVRGEEHLSTTVAPVPYPKNVPAIITPRSVSEDHKQQFKQPVPAFQQVMQANAAELLPSNPVMATSNALQNLYQPPALGQPGAPVIQPFTLPPNQSPKPMFPQLIAPQLHAQVPPGFPSAAGTPSLPNGPNSGASQLGPMQQLPTGLRFPQGQVPSVPAGHFADVSQPPTPPPIVLPPQLPLTGQIPSAQ